MTAAAWSVFAFGLYLAGGGLVLVFLPGLACRAVGLPVYEGIWIRLTGMFFLLFSNYCIRAAITEQRDFMRWTITTRPITLLFILGLMAAGLAPGRLLIFGIIDVLASLWTALALRPPASAVAPQRNHA